MAIADIAANFSNRMVSPLGGLNRGIEQGQNRALVNQQADRQNRMLDIQESNLQAESDQLAESQANKRLGVAGFAAYSADTPEEWVKAQQAVPELQSVPFEQRETFTQNALVNSIGPEKTNKILNPKAANEVNVKTIVGGEEQLSFDQQVERDRIKTSSTERAKANEKRYADTRAKVFDQAENAADVEQTIRTQLMINADTGPGESKMDAGRRGLLATARFFNLEDTMGDTIQKVNDNASFTAIQEKMVGDKLRAEPGVKTDGDAQRMRTTLANINNPVESNKFISNMLLSDAIRRQDRADFLQRAVDSGETNMDKVNKDWRKFIRDTPQLGKSPATGKPIFFHQLREANPDASADEILKIWQEDYANN